jgi:hypothetical protein
LLNVVDGVPGVLARPAPAFDVAGRGRPALHRQSNFCTPYPRIVKGIAYQAGPHRILQHVIKFFCNLLLFPQRPVERLLLPNFRPAIQKSFNPVRGSAFDRLHDFGDGNGPARATTRSDGEVDMIWHDDDAMKVKLQTISGEAAFDNNCPRRRRQSPSKIGTESDEYYLEVRLEMRQTTAIFVGVHNARFSIAPRL